MVALPDALELRNIYLPSVQVYGTEVRLIDLQRVFRISHLLIGMVEVIYHADVLQPGGLDGLYLVLRLAKPIFVVLQRATKYRAGKLTQSSGRVLVFSSVFRQSTRLSLACSLSFPGLAGCITNQLAQRSRRESTRAYHNFIIYK